MAIKITMLLLSWKRHDNIPTIIDSIKNQSIDTEIFLWNNDVENTARYDVDLQINSSKNLMCWTRWLMTAYATGDYICTLDDDLCFADENVLEDCVNYCIDNDCSIGGFGAILDEEKEYFKSKHIVITKREISDDTCVDVIKGRFILAPADLLKNLPLKPEQSGTDDPRIEDDIIVSSFLERKIIPKFLHGRLRELPLHGQGLMFQPEHMQSREMARRKYL
jgi:hypothetical protein